VVFDVPLDDAKAQNAKSKAEREKALEDAQVRAARPYDWADIEKARERLKLLGNHVPTLDQLPNEPLPLEGPVLRRFHVEDALDTDPDLSGGYTDVSNFVRARDRDLYVYVLWAQLPKIPDQPPSHPDEICPVPIYEMSRVLRGKEAFRMAFNTKGRNRAWQRLIINHESIRPGGTLMLDLDAGGYSEERGWLAITYQVTLRSRRHMSHGTTIGEPGSAPRRAV
jgi:CRISPR-associated endonuclease/helicase Cas3